MVTSVYYKITGPGLYHNLCDTTQALGCIATFVIQPRPWVVSQRLGYQPTGLGCITKVVIQPRAWVVCQPWPL